MTAVMLEQMPLALRRFASFVAISCAFGVTDVGLSDVLPMMESFFYAAILESAAMSRAFFSSFVNLREFQVLNSKLPEA